MSSHSQKAKKMVPKKIKSIIYPNGTCYICLGKTEVNTLYCYECKFSFHYDKWLVEDNCYT